MNFEDRVKSIVSKQTDQLLELFQDAESRTSDLEDKLDLLLQGLSITKDIKTEVARIEKSLIPNRKEDDEEDEPQEDTEPPKGEDIIDLMEMLEYFQQHSLPNGTMDQLLLDGPPGLPIPFVPRGRGSAKPFTAKDAFKLLTYIWKWIKDVKQSVRNGINEAIRNATLDGAKSQLDYINMAVNSIQSILKSDVKEQLDRILDDIENCCSSTSETLDDMGNQLEAISRKIDQLDPASAADKDLSLQTKTKAILSEIQSVRGLL